MSSEKILGEMVKTKDKVSYLLAKYPELRDNDKLLWLAVMCLFHGLKDVLGPEVYPVFKEWILSESTPNYESVRRTRAKLQEEREDLRGELYFERQALSGVVSDFMVGKDDYVESP